eukprot:CAMPEP_0174327374 /NCGR_PEP_ID=MMETSP0810-20121108/14478_1 /TAXON_ID=73025 ORGANISM="Eutreptiella gymnastica-like, Strain CCMP1594" /NCGR_SAMPLE_ID=MMETSP0810 /ASSEMBLY_ACC=CAM_ASM_000659 /LENGTH=359 /DNA_ID=CAMNT_0015441207 /DNA_START=38 /DNA_END=1118 /DNA_ORIENTATION=-
MSLLSMPFLVTNLGGEMIFILEQRLHAQNIPKEKSNKVLQDVSRAMFSQKFINELTKPQEIYSSSATREIFDRLAHSSIMRLSESSMDKLYDLMTMGFKHQIVTCTHPRELIEVTLNHLESIRASVESNAQTVELVDGAIAQVVKLCSEISNSEFAQIRQSLAKFFQVKRIKVSLFLQDGIQSADGTIVIPKGGPLVNDETVEAPGTIRYYDDSGAVSSTETFSYALADCVGARLTGDPFDKNEEAAKAAAKPAASTATTTSAKKMKENKGAAVCELKSLRDMISSAPADNAFKITNLFGGDGDADAAPGTQNIVISKITREEMLTTNAALVDVMKSMDVGDSQSKDKDLLSLMDDASM